MRILNKIKKIISSCILCIRFPFLYPRNRFTDKHYNNWKIIEFHRKHFNDAFKAIPLEEIDEKAKAEINNRKRQRYHLLELFEIKKGKKFLAYKIMFLDWLNEKPFQWFHIIPTYTELDMMPTGWRKAFGIQMCKEVKAQLLKDGGRKLLRKYRITQIKEKYGTLRWYCTWGSNSLYHILDRYEDLSAKICIKCGKPAEVISTGWISPYCKNCIGNRDSISIEEYYNPSNYEDLEASKENIDS